MTRVWSESVADVSRGTLARVIFSGHAATAGSQGVTAPRGRGRTVAKNLAVVWIAGRSVRDRFQVYEQVQFFGVIIIHGLFFSLSKSLDLDRTKGESGVAKNSI